MSAWNNLQIVRANLVSAQQKITRVNDYTANLYTDFRLQEGRLRGLKVGGGVNLRGNQIIGYRGGDSIRNPADATTSVDDPKVDAYDTVRSGAYYALTADLAYNWRIGNGKIVSLFARVDNLLNETKPLYFNTLQRPPGGDLTNPARVSTPGNFFYLAPRTWSIGASHRF